jgi:endoglycosylceramidase
VLNPRKTGAVRARPTRSHHPTPGSVGLVALLVLGAYVTLLTGVGGGATPARRPAGTAGLPNLSSAVEPAPSLGGQPPLTGPLRAPGGPFLFDRSGRVVFLHGVNVVYKRPPYEVYPDPGKAWNFGASDASLMARLGFNVVRLGMTWKGLEPGTAPANDPAICANGAPRNPHQFSQAVLDRYLSRLKRTVNVLARFHIFTILDMHQDVYNELFEGEGAPNWAVCTSGKPNIDPPGRWSKAYGTPAAGAAFHHFWKNNVVGDLQGQLDLVWGKVARYFAHDPWVIGFDPFNEPFSTSLLRHGDEHFDAQLECFYTGAARIGSPLHGAPRITCPRRDPAVGVIPTLLTNGRNALIFDEPDNFASRGFPTFLGSMNFPNLVFNFHVYCGARSPLTGNPTDLPACIAQEHRALARRAEDRPEMASAKQPGGPAWFMSEFGATSDPTLLSSVTAQADQLQVGWTYWSWRYYADPTGSAAEALVMADGKLRSTASVLSRVYPEVVAGKPRSFSFDPATDRFLLTYQPTRSAHGPTVVVVPTQIHYVGGYCARATGARITSSPTAPLLELGDAGRGVVRLLVAPGRCATSGRNSAGRYSDATTDPTHTRQRPTGRVAPANR